MIRSMIFVARASERLLYGFHRPWREAAVDETTVAGVPGRIRRDHHGTAGIATDRVGALVRVEQADTAHLRREERSVAIHPHHVAMLHNVPEATAMRVVLPRDGRLASQAREECVLLAALEHVEIKQVEVHAFSFSPCTFITVNARAHHSRYLWNPEAGRISRSRWLEVSPQASLSSGSSPFASPHSTHRDIEMGLSA